MLYFAYGSNLNHFQMNRRCKDSKFLKKIKLKDFKLTFRSKYRAADIEPKKKSIVPGGLFEISKSDEKIFQHERVDTENNHGTGCTLASSIAAKIAQNKKMKVAVEESINYVVQLLEVSPKVGSGNGPLVHCIKLT